MAGKEYEAEVYSMIRAAIRKRGDLKNIVVVSNLYHKQGNNMLENDFVVLLAKLRLILHIEAKTTLEDSSDSQASTVLEGEIKNEEPDFKPSTKKKRPMKNPRDKAKEQFDHGLKFFREVCSDKGWSYCKVLAARSISQAKADSCAKCQPFFFKDGETFDELLNSLEKENRGKLTLTNHLGTILTYFCSLCSFLFTYKYLQQ